MAKSRAPEKPVEPESEDDDNSSEEIESESEPEQTQITKKPSSSKHQPLSQLSFSSDEEESDSDADAVLNVKPIASKPSDDAKKPRSKPITSEPATPSKSTLKRPAEEKEADAQDSKRSKKKLVPEKEPGSAALDSSKRALFQRLWSEDDEIVILKGMLDYTAKKKSNPLSDPDAFLEFIKKNLHFDGNKTQLQDKIKRLKKKYEKNKGKGRNFSKPHEKEAYELSENIWGNEKGKEIVVASPKANGKAPSKKMDNGVENEKDDDLMSIGVASGDAEKVLAPVRVGSYGLNLDERVLSIGAGLFEGVNGVEEGAKEWRKLMLEEMEISIKQMDVMRARAKLVLDVLKSRNH